MAALTAEQIAWAASVGIDASRAAWLASCPKFTRWDYELKAPEDRNLWLNGRHYYFRAQVGGVVICENLRTTDIATARRVRDERLTILRSQ